MTYRSQSRGFMYTAPPGPEDEENRPAEETADERTTDEKTTADEAADAAPELEPTTGKTDANWTGSVSTDAPADD